MKTFELLFFVFFICQVYGYGMPRGTRTFRCHNESIESMYNAFYDYIDEECFCDGRQQCSDGEDENFGCDKNNCGQKKFACDGNQCKDINVRCNTVKDCQDGTDELNCGDEINVNNCTSEDVFLCKDKLRCLDLEYTCDNYCHCFDCSDENENCSQHDEDFSKKCPDAYFPTPNGPQCYCGSSNITSNKLCNNPFVLLYTNKVEIQSLSNPSRETSIVAHGISNCTMLTAANNYVYYATISSNKTGSIFKVSLNSGEPEKLIETDSAITSMAVDYLTNNIYFTSNGSLSVCTSNGRICAVLKCCYINSIALAPKSGLMFYMQMETRGFCRNRYLLVRSNMDGSNETMHAGDCYKGETFIEMDESNKTMYLVENDKKMGTVHYQVSLDSPFDKDDANKFTFHGYMYFCNLFTFYNGGVFFTECKVYTHIPMDYDIHYARSTLSHDQKPLTYFRNNSTSAISYMHVYNPVTELDNENPCNKSLCSGLCLVKSEVQSSKSFLSHTCLCNNFAPSDDHHWCSSDSAHAGNHRTIWMIICILASISFGVTIYMMFKKYTWHANYVTLQWWKGSKSGKGIISDEEL